MAAALIIGITVSAPGAGPPALSQTSPDCLDPSEPTPELYGPTDISGVTGNRNLSVAVNPKATVTVLKWPSPSFYDQIKYRARDRSRRRFGALPNEGAFFGLAFKKEKEWRFDWLRSWRSRQRWADDDTDELITTFTRNSPRIEVTVRDLVLHDRDVLARRVSVDVSRSSNVRLVRLFAFANFNPVFSKSAQAPFQDWCFEESNDDGAIFRANHDAVVHGRSGLDASTGASVSVFLAMGFTRPSDGYQVGQDTYETSGPGASAYDDASDGGLTGDATAEGQVDAALFDQLFLGRDRRVATTLLVTAGAEAGNALDVLRSARGDGYSEMRRAKARWWRGWLADAPLPRNAPGRVVELSKRALITLRQAIDEDTADIDPEGSGLPAGGTIVASIATQSPYGLDWIRDGAYLNHALDIAGHHDIVRRHNRRYAVLQTKAGDQTRGGQPIPPGNWHMNFYADGVVGGTIPYEIDETGYGIWTLWDHYEMTGNRDYLVTPVIYEAIQRAAQYLTDVCRDLSNGLQCVANEGDDPNPSQTLRGAMLVWLGLDSAAKAARVLGGEIATANAIRWETRRDEIAAAIETQFYDPECECYTTDFGDGGTLLWPVEFLADRPGREAAQAEENWTQVAPAFRNEDDRGRFEAKALLGNAFAWAGDDEQRDRLEKGLRWIASVPTTNETGILGEGWMRYPDPDSPVVTMVSQPHVWEQILFYLAALEVYGKAPYTFDD